MGLFGGGEAPSGNKGESKPWSKTQRNLQQFIWNQSKGAYEQTPKEAYSGDYYGGQSQETKDYSKMLGTAIGQDYGQDQVKKNADMFASGVLGDPKTNPWLKGAMDAANTSTLNTFNRQTLPAITSKAVAGGAYGGSRNAIAEAVAAGETNKAIQDSNANITYGNYQHALDLQAGAGQMYAQAASLGQVPLGYAQQRAQLEDYNRQQLANQDLSRYNASVSAPWNGLSNLGQLGFVNTGQDTYGTAIGGSSAGAGMGALQGAAGGAAMGTAIMPGWGTAIGAGVGALAGAFG